MPLYALLTYDLGDRIPAEARAEFVATLKREGWVKIKDISTAFFRTFKPNATVEEALAVTKLSLIAAKTRSGDYPCNAVVQIGPNKPQKA
jgi:hypothetical protein